MFCPTAVAVQLPFPTAEEAMSCLSRKLGELLPSELMFTCITCSAERVLQCWEEYAHGIIFLQQTWSCEHKQAVVVSQTDEQLASRELADSELYLHGRIKGGWRWMGDGYAESATVAASRRNSSVLSDPSCHILAGEEIPSYNLLVTRRVTAEPPGCKVDRGHFSFGWNGVVLKGSKEVHSILTDV